MDTFLDVSGIVKRAKQALNFKKDSELASYLGVSRATLSNWCGFYKGNFFAGDLLHPAQGFLGRVDQIVCYHDLIARLDKLHAGVAADVTGAAADQNRHGKHSFQNKRAAAQMGRFDPKFIPSL